MTELGDGAGRGAGMSIVALSDSSVMSGSSAATSSPAATCTSMTGTSSKSPMSGTLIVDVRLQAGRWLLARRRVAVRA